MRLALLGIGVCAALCVLGGSDVYAQVSLFRPDGAIPDAPSTGFGVWISEVQSDFYRRLVEAIGAFRDNPSAAYWLVTASFLYGVFHAAGPGHGKVILSSYMLASRAQIRRGLALSLASSLVQGATALAVVGILVALFNATGGEINSQVWTLEKISFGLMTLLGFWLVWVKVFRPVFSKSVLPSNHDHVHDHTHAHVHDHSCADGCGHAHGPSMEQVAEPLTWKTALAICLSIGLRPCTGAVVVLVFALSQSMPWAGALSVLAMSFGTAATVSVLVILTVGGRAALLSRFDAGSVVSQRVHRGIEMAGSVLVLSFGLVFLLGSFGARPVLM